MNKFSAAAILFERGARPALMRFRRALVAAGLLVAGLGALWLGAAVEVRAESGQKPGEIKAAIKEAKSKAEEGKAGLTRLTDRERELNAGLAAAEDRISVLEKNLTLQETQLGVLESAHEENARAYDVLVASKGEAEKDLLDLLSFLWPLYNMQDSVGARDGTLWSDVEREYTWTAELMRAIAEKQAVLKENEAALSENLSQREVLARQLRDQVAIIKTDKETLLADMLKFNQELSSIRQEKRDLESTLQSINDTIDKLNVQLEISAAAEAEAARAAQAAKAEAAAREARAAKEAARAAAKEKAEKDSAEKTQVAAAEKGSGKSGADALADKNAEDASVSGKGTGSIAKGKTPWPARGKVVVHYAPDASPPVHGIGLALNDGTPVKAVAWGKVVHSDVLRGLGYVVVLMHPKQYYTVYAHLTGSKYKVGQEVKQGEVLGRAGLYPPAGGAGIYFELRSHEKAVNPEAWLSRN